MTSDQILAEIAANPALQALATAKDWASLANALSAGRTKVVAKIITARGIASAHPAGALAAEVVLLKLEGARDNLLASADAGMRVLGSLLRRQLAFLATEGLDFGDATLRAMLDQFATSTPQILTPEEASALKGMALEPDSVSALDVEHAVALQPVTTWAGQVTSTELRDGMVLVAITYTSSAPGVTARSEQVFGDDLTPGRVAAIIARRVDSLQKADSALVAFG